MAQEKDIRCSSLPYRTIRCGEVVRIGGGEYRVVERPVGLDSREACRGCVFRLGTCPASLACSAFDRRDGRFVWFVKLKEKGYEDSER